MFGRFQRYFSRRIRFVNGVGRYCNTIYFTACRGGSYRFPGSSYGPFILALPLPMMHQRSDHDDNGEPRVAPKGFTNYVIAVVGTIGVFIAGYVTARYFAERKRQQMLEKKEEEVIHGNSRVSEILILGRAGIGKSYLVNAICRENVSKENANDTGTFSAELFQFSVKNRKKTRVLATLNIWDTVGFFGDQSKQYCVDELRDAENCDALILAVNGSDRLYKDVKNLSEILNELYGGQDWVNRCIVVVTKCNEYENNKGKRAMEKRRENWKSMIVEQLADAGLKDAESMPIIWAKGKNDENWIREMVIALITRAQQDCKDVIAMMHPEKVDDELKEQLSDDVKDYVEVLDVNVLLLWALMLLL